MIKDDNDYLDRYMWMFIEHVNRIFFTKDNKYYEKIYKNKYFMHYEIYQYNYLNTYNQKIDIKKNKIISEYYQLFGSKYYFNKYIYYTKDYSKIRDIIKHKYKYSKNNKFNYYSKKIDYYSKKINRKDCIKYIFKFNYIYLF